MHNMEAHLRHFKIIMKPDMLQTDGHNFDFHSHEIRHDRMSKAEMQALYNLIYLAH